MMHGWGSGAASLPAIDILRLANCGCVVVVPGMRGRDSADGGPDASAREIYDIIDAVGYVRNNAPYSTYASTTKAAIVGYSGGGGNTMAAACKFPDFFNVAIAYFGMSDYGRDNPDGWWYNNNGSYTAGIEAWVGGDPATVPENYYARDATAAIQNFTGGFLYLYHDKQDTLVPWVHSDRIKSAMDAAPLTNYSANFSDTGDSPRWLHGYPNDNPNTLSQAELTWIAKIGSQSVWTIATSGTVTVIGYIITKRFEVWLRANGSVTYGLDAAATVVYDTATDSYTVTPLTGAIDVTVTQGAKTGSATNISVETEIIVS